jgi:hypothetical protein
MKALQNPWVVAVLNWLTFGLGTVILGRHRAAGLLMMVGGTLAQGAEIAVSPFGSNAIPTVWPLLLGGLIVLKFGIATLGYQQAKSAVAA